MSNAERILEYDPVPSLLSPGPGLTAWPTTENSTKLHLLTHLQFVVQRKKVTFD